jgi:precorrin-4/cobalt-precorrin-4 C11-methyltransferase
MTVFFIGAGPGAADLLTLRGRDILARCPVCLYAGSIVPRAMLAHCPAGARLVDTAPLSLDAIEAEYQAAHAAGLDVARLHSGDLSVYSAAAVLGRELTVPGLAQSLVLTRIEGRAP